MQHNCVHRDFYLPRETIFSVQYSPYGCYNLHTVKERYQGYVFNSFFHVSFLCNIKYKNLIFRYREILLIVNYGYSYKFMNTINCNLFDTLISEKTFIHFLTTNSLIIFNWSLRIKITYEFKI